MGWELDIPLWLVLLAIFVVLFWPALLIAPAVMVARAGVCQRHPHLSIGLCSTPWIVTMVVPVVIAPFAVWLVMQLRRVDAPGFTVRMDSYFDPMAVVVTAVLSAITLAVPLDRDAS